SGGRRKQSDDYVDGADLRYDLEITLEEAFKGIKKTIEIPVHEICKKCSGFGAESKNMEKCTRCEGSGKIRTTKRQGFTQFVSLSPCDKCQGIGKVIMKYCENCKGKGRIEKEKTIEIKVPKGINHGQHLRIEEGGEIGRNAPNGDLYIVIHIKKHQSFKREDENLFLEKEISLAVAIFGGDIEIEGIDKKINLKIPQETQSHTPFKLEGQGMPLINSRERGDLYVLITVKIPKVNKNKEKKFEDFFEHI
ncbi:MAG: DnaJ C-terminal domain-containing protein, partial [Nanoarchaeota archaeon]